MRRARLQPYIFVTPYALFAVFFGLVPALVALYLSFTNEDESGFHPTIANFVAAAEDFRFIASYEHIAIYLLLWLPTLIVIVFGAALLLEARAGVISTTMRVLYYVPGAIAGTASVLVWLFMVDPPVSPFGPIWHLFGWYNVNQVVTESHIAMVVTLIALSTGAGGWIVIVYGALRGLSTDVIDAARIDGCGGLRLAWHIKLPQVSRYAAFIVIVSIATGTQVFAEPQILYSTNVGFVDPAWSPNQLAYAYAFTYGRFGVSAAISIELFAIALVIALFVIFRTRFYAID